MQLPGLAVEARDLAAVENHRLERAVRRLEPAEHAVAGEFDAQIQPFAAGRRIDQQRIDPGTVRAAVESLERAPVHPQRRLAVADPQQVDAFACPLGGHVRRYPKPVAGPQRAEPVAEIRVAVGQCVGLVRRDAVHRPSNLEYLWISSVSPDQRMNPIAHLGNAITSVLRVPLHPPTLRVVRAAASPQARSRGAMFPIDRSDTGVDNR